VRPRRLALVTASLGITISEIAVKMRTRQNYLYRVLPGLADEGLVTKDGRGWHPGKPPEPAS
jgi:DNA-binding IclR family transcriptional regulator